MYCVIRICAVLLGTTSMWAQEPSSVERLVHIGIGQGLSDHTVTCLIQDPRGFTWIGTMQGLNRFDGERVRNYNKSNSALPSNVIYDIRHAGPGEIALATGNGICLMRTITEQIRCLTLPASLGMESYTNTIEKLFVTSDAYFLAATSTGVYVLDSTGLLHAALEAGFVADDIGKRRIYFVLNMEMFSNGDAIISSTRGYYLYTHHNRSFISLETSTNSAYQLFKKFIPAHAESYTFNIDHQDRLYFIDFKSDREDSMHVFDIPGNSHVALPLGFIPNQNMRWDAKVQIHRGDMITITCNRNGFYAGIPDWMDGQWKQSPVRHLYGVNCRSILQLRDGRFVYGTESGVFSQSFAFESLSHLYLEDHFRFDRQPRISSVIVHDDRLWVGINSPEHGILLFDDQDIYQSARSINGRGVLPNLVRHLTVWTADSILIGTQHGAYIMHTTNADYRPLAAAAGTEHDINGAVTGMFVDTKGDVWLGFYDRYGVWRYIRDTGKLYRYFPGDPEFPGPLRTAQLFTEDAHGHLWAMHSEDGLARWNRTSESWDRVIRSVPGSASPVFGGSGLAISDRGGLWVFIDFYGLVHVDPVTEHFELFAAIREQANGNSQAITVTDDGEVWLNLKHGLVRIDPKDKRMQTYTSRTGIPDRVNTMYTLYQDTARRRMIAGYAGQLLFIDLDIPVADVPARPWITSVESMRDLAVLDFRSPLVLPFHQNALRIHLAVVDYEPGLPTYLEYTLGASVNPEWTSLDDQRFFILSNLTPGRYAFRVRIAGSERTDAWSEVIRITIRPPYYRTWWFIALCLILGLAAIYALYLMRLRQLQRIREVRDRISADLHDDIGSRLTQLRFLTVLAQQGARSQDSLEFLEKMETEITSGSDALHEIVGHMKSGPVTINASVAEMRRHILEVSEIDDIDINLSANVLGAMMLTAEQHRNLLLVCKEIITNVRKHADAKRVEIKVTSDPKSVSLRCIDDGKGFDPGTTTHRNGIYLMRQRLARHDGVLEIDSSPGQGTMVYVRIPLRRVSLIGRIVARITGA